MIEVRVDMFTTHLCVLVFHAVDGPALVAFTHLASLIRDPKTGVWQLPPKGEDEKGSEVFLIINELLSGKR